jgi:serine/threonine-protein kinase
MEAHADREAAAAPPERGGSGPRQTPPSHPSDFGYEARYVPGTTLLDRYRIVSPLGKGGMGEVYRAEDLKLGQTVALKFMPKSLARNEEALARFTREVRMARQVSHPNVCRVFDIGEADGQTFLTMEFVDGEDMSSLMRRIGRLPADKALEIARQVCAGLAAAHELGIIHRDLKPANIMLDGRGRARITDFGLAGLATEMKGEDARAGTPAYMSPEQFSGGEITPRSDLYSLGIVLYEVFTGKRPFAASTAIEMAQHREKNAITLPSAYVKEIDPLVERVIMRCLEQDPAKRPASAIQVAAALPGSDPLAAALAAGETPSPEMVAAAGTEGALNPWIACSILAGFILLLCANVFLSERSQLINLLPAGKSPEILQEDSKNILKSIGYNVPVADSGYWLSIDDDYWPYSSQISAPERYRMVGTDFPSPVRFAYRQSPAPLQTTFPYQVARYNPAHPAPGDSIVELDEQGLLSSLRITAVTNSQQDSKHSDSQAPAGSSLAEQQAWPTLFGAAKLDMEKFKSVDADWYPREIMDRQLAWEGQQFGKLIRVHAGTIGGKPVYFEVLAPWKKESASEYNSSLGAYRLVNVIYLTFAASLFCLASFLAIRNLRRARSDARGGIRGSALLFVALSISIILDTHWAGDALWGWDWWQLCVALPAGLALQYAAFYVGFEPYFRGTWPELLISWSRFLAGDTRNPLVGRDVLVGAFVGAAAAALYQSLVALPYWFSIKSVTPEFTANSGLASFIGGLSAGIVNPFLNAIWCLAFLFVALKLLRRKSIAVLAMCTVWTMFSLQIENPWGLLPISILIAVLMTICTLKNGALGIVVAMFVAFTIRSQPLTWEFSRWYAPYSMITLLVMLAIAFYGFSCSLGGRSLLGDELGS